MKDEYDDDDDDDDDNMLILDIWVVLNDADNTDDMENADEG